MTASWSWFRERRTRIKVALVYARCNERLPSLVVTLAFRALKLGKL